MGGIHFTNLMLEIEKLNSRLHRIEEKLDVLKVELELAQGIPEVQPEDFSRFIDFGKIKEEKGFE